MVGIRSFPFGAFRPIFRGYVIFRVFLGFYGYENQAKTHHRISPTPNGWTRNNHPTVNRYTSGSSLGTKTITFLRLQPSVFRRRSTNHFVSLKLTAILPLEMDGCNMISFLCCFLLGPGLFSGAKMLVSGRAMFLIGGGIPISALALLDVSSERVGYPQHRLSLFWGSVISFFSPPPSTSGIFHGFYKGSPLKNIP